MATRCHYEPSSGKLQLLLVTALSFKAGLQSWAAKLHGASPDVNNIARSINDAHMLSREKSEGILLVALEELVVKP